MVNFQRLSNGQMARLNNISEQTLRLYDREKLLSPAVRDKESGYRYYHIIQSAKLDMIQYMKAYGLKLKEIRACLDRNDPSEIQRILKRQMQSINIKIDALKKTQRAITRTLENYRRYESLPKNGIFFLEYMPQRRIYRYASENNFFETDFAGYEYMLRELKQHLATTNLAMTYFCNVGTIMRLPHIMSGNFYANEVFLFVDDEIDKETETLPAASYYCVCSDDFSKEAENAGMLLKEIERVGFAVSGDYICEVIIDFPSFESSTREMFYKIQIPVTPR